MQLCDYMKRALELAQKGNGYTSPNPLVGAVIVKNGKIIGEGYHPQYGKKHAEIMAIENAKESVEGSEMYCNLEPCSHSVPPKKTPPCAQRLIGEKIRKIYISTLDPNPLVNGKGVSILREAGIKVEIGKLAPQSALLNEAYFKYIQTQIPFIHLKMALSLDGKIATQSCDSKWITDEAARKVVHQMRHGHDAVLVGINTILTDNPNLTVRLVEGRQPFRIVLDSKLDIPLESNLLQDRYKNKTIIFTNSHHNFPKQELIEKSGVRINSICGAGNNKVDLKTMLEELGKLGISSLLVEGGGGIFTDFISQNFFDKVSIFVSPIIIGKGIEAIGDLGIQKISEAVSLQKIKYRIINKQILIQGYRQC